ncbi:MAG: type II secretion system F family protein [Pseudoclavibacter sp.]
MAVEAPFRYQGVTAAGKRSSGQITAANENTALAKLRAQGIVPFSIEQVSTRGLHAEINIPGLQKRVKLKDLSVLSRQLATMIGAGLPLVHSLAIVTDQLTNARLKKAMEDIRDGVQAGQALSAGLTAHRDIFPPLFISLVRSGETSGSLDTALVGIADSYDREVSLHNQIKSAMTYPVVVLIVSLLGVLAMIWFLVPVFEDMFKSLGGTLPLPTQILVVISHQMVWAGPLVIILAVVGFVLFRRFRQTPFVRNAWEPLILKLPVIGGLAQKLAVARFSRNLSVMTRSGVTLLQALDVVASTAGNIVVETAVRRVAEAVRNGESLSAPMSREPIFPVTAVQMIEAGESSGALDQMLQRVADYFDQEVATATAQLTSVIEPLMIVVVGGLVGSMIIALYLPMFNINTLVGKS